MKFKKDDAVYELCRLAGAIPLSYEAETEAVKMLNRWNKQQYTMRHILRALEVCARKYNEKFITDDLRRAIDEETAAILGVKTLADKCRHEFKRSGSEMICSRCGLVR